MKFKKVAHFLAIATKTLKDGTAYYEVTVFVDEDAATVKFNLGAKHPSLSAFQKGKFGDEMHLIFALQESDGGRYKLRLAQLV